MGRGPEGDAQPDFWDAPHDAEVQDRIQANEHQQRRQTRKVKGTQTHRALAKQRNVASALQGVDLEQVVASEGGNRPPSHSVHGA